MCSKCRLFSTTFYLRDPFQIHYRARFVIIYSAWLNLTPESISFVHQVPFPAKFDGIVFHCPVPVTNRKKMKQIESLIENLSKLRLIRFRRILRREVYSRKVVLFFCFWHENEIWTGIVGNRGYRWCDPVEDPGAWFSNTSRNPPTRENGIPKITPSLRGRCSGFGSLNWMIMSGYQIQ